MRSSEAVPYRGLWSAVIVQAFVDLKPRDFLTPYPIIKPTGDSAKDSERLYKALANRKVTRKAWDNIRQSALRWIFSDDSMPCSFSWICDSLDLDKEYLRGLALTREGINKVLTGKSL